MPETIDEGGIIEEIQPIDIENSKGEIISKKPPIEETKELTEEEKKDVESSLKVIPVFENESTDYLNFIDYQEKDINPVFIDGKKVIGFTSERNLIHKELRPIKNDYANDFRRGTVEYSDKCFNYSFHKVVIPDGTVIKGKNFSQVTPDTEAISGKNITFIECNLCNVKIDPTWVLQSSLTIKKKVTITKSNDHPDGKDVSFIVEVMPKDSVSWEQVETVSKIMTLDEFALLNQQVEVQNGIK